MASAHGIIRGGIIVLVLIAMCLCASAEWLSHGNGIRNRRQADGEFKINPTTSRKLHLKWKFFAGKDISATPAVSDGVVYFPSWNGHIYAIKASNGELIWDKSVGELTGLSGTGLQVNVSVCRSTPAVAGDKLVIGIYGPAVVIALCRLTGRLLWSTRLDPRPLALITQSGTFYKGSVYIGVSSLEGILPASQCCTFRGSLAKLDAQTGKIIWQTYTIPDNGGTTGGYSGAPIWGSSPSIDTRRKHVYIGTGQLYSAPQQVLECQIRQNNQTTPTTQFDQCVGQDVHFDSILALDIDTGAIAWFRQLGGYDVFVFACLFPGNPDCPPGPNLDADFGEAPMLLTIYANATKRDVVVAVQKSGFAWSLDRDNGDIVWFKLAGPGGLGGGGTWGAATDGKRVYTNIANSNRKNFTLSPSKNITTGGGWVALDAVSGQILWSTANPGQVASDGPVTIANGVLFAGSVASDGPFYAIDAKNGEILWSYNTGASVYGGAAVSYGCAYVGSGYHVGRPNYTPGNSLFAFCVV